MYSTVSGVTGFVDGINSVGTCANTCRVACRADNSAEGANTGQTCTDDSGVYTCVGSTADQMINSQRDVASGILAQAVVLEDLLKTMVPTPYAASRPMRTQSVAGKQQSPPSLTTLVAAQPSRAQAVAAATHIAEVLSAAREAYDVIVPTEQWLARHSSDVAAAVAEQRAGAHTRAQQTLLSAVGGLVRTLGVADEPFAPGVKLAKVMGSLKM